MLIKVTTKHFENIIVWENPRQTRGFFFPAAILDDLVISPKKHHPGESRGPELIEITGFRLPPE